MLNLCFCTLMQPWKIRFSHCLYFYLNFSSVMFLLCRALVGRRWRQKSLEEYSLTITLLSKVINPISKYSSNSKHTTNIFSQIPQSILPRSFIALQNFYFTSEISCPSFRTLLGSFLLPCHALRFDWFGFQF